MMFHRAATLLLAVGLASATTTQAPATTAVPAPAPTAGTVHQTSDAARKLPPFPDVRFTQWDNLSQANKDHAHRAGYHQKDWNKPAESDLEELDFESLETKSSAELAAMGITAEQWDCYVNHFRNYDWEELEYHTAAFETLGWTEDDWEDDEDETDIEGKYWEELTPIQQRAAASICYTQELWDEVAIPLWGQDNGSGGETGVPDAKDLYSVKETEVATEKQDFYENLYDVGDRDQTSFEGPASAHNDRNIPVPFFRYVPWDLLTTDVQKLANESNYDEKSWNAIGSHPMEKHDFETIGNKEPNVRKALEGLGFTEDQWDCYISHYQSYEWDELVDAQVQQYFSELGWSHKAWDEGTEPDTAGKYWPELTPTLQNAAYQVGFFREVWDEVSLQFWPRTTANTASLKGYAKQHPAAVGGGLAIFFTFLIGCIFACVCLFRPKRNKFAPTDLEMYPPPPGFNGGYSDDPDGAALKVYDGQYGKTPTIC